MNKPHNNPMAKYLAKPTRGNAIKAMCAHCVGCTYDEMETGFRHLIRTCQSVGCPLHRYRPYQNKREDNHGDSVAEGTIGADDITPEITVAGIS